MAIRLPFDTPTANVLRFILIEYIIIKLFSFVTESFAKISASRRIASGQTVCFQEGWPTFFLVPYRIQERPFLRRWVPWLLVIIFNAFVLSIEFGFQSETIQEIPLKESVQQISTPQLRRSRVLEGVTDINWVSRAELIAKKCTDQRGLEVYAAEGFLRGALLDGDRESLEKAEILCADDSRLRFDLDRVMFNVSYMGLLDTREPFRHATLELDVNNVTDNLFTFQGGDIDLEVNGNLDLSLDAPKSRDHVFDVSGSCTLFSEFDPRLYCYLSDGNLNRFIVPAVVESTSDISSPVDIAEGNKLQLRDSGPVFRAEMLLFDERWVAKDGDHLAAIKSLVATFSPRQGSRYDDVVISQYLPSVVRSFYMATMIGATSVRNVSFNIETADPVLTERAQVTSWAFAMFCVVIGTLTTTAVFNWVFIRRIKWNIPVSYNALAKIAMDEYSATNDLTTNRSLTCGLNGDKFGFRPGSLDCKADERKDVDSEV